MTCGQCDQIGWFLKVLGDKFSYNMLTFWAFWKHPFSFKNFKNDFWATLYFSVWSHCLQHPIWALYFRVEKSPFARSDLAMSGKIPWTSCRRWRRSWSPTFPRGRPCRRREGWWPGRTSMRSPWPPIANKWRLRQVGNYDPNNKLVVKSRYV